SMSCGTLVAGFGGSGPFGHPYATPDNGFWAQDESVDDATRKLEEAIEAARHAGMRAEAMVAAGHVTAQRYGRDAVRLALGEMVRRLEGDARSQAADPQALTRSAWTAGTGLWLRGQIAAARRLMSSRVA